MTPPENHFWNLPGDKNVRKRSIVVSFTDKSGTYSDPKNKVTDVLDQISHDKIFSDNAACKMREELKTRGVWKYITSFAVLVKSDGLLIKSDNPDTYISSAYTIKFGTIFNLQKLAVHLVLILKSKEITSGKSCDKTCNNQGSCQTLPYSSANYCQCKPYFQGM